MPKNVVKDMADVDFVVENHGTIFLLCPMSIAAEEWTEKHIPEDALMWGRGVAVEHRYIADIVEGIENDGLGVELR